MIRSLHYTHSIGCVITLHYNVVMWQYNEWVGKKTNYDDLIQPPYQVSAFLSGMSFSALRIICDV